MSRELFIVMGQPDIQKYSELMKEIKLRMKVIDFFAIGKGHALYQPTTVESICLQLRKILELIAMGSLVANKEEYSKVYTDFAKHWNAKYLMNALEKVNPNFYPEPIIEEATQEMDIKSALKKREEDYLTKEEFIKVYEKCGAIMHSGNPFGSRVDYNWYEKNYSTWYMRIINLPNSHKITLVNDPNIYLIHMHEEGDDEIHYYIFEPIQHL
jgi:hypothetical protein